MRYDKNLLPKAMQLRRGEFGKKGQVKSLDVFFPQTNTHTHTLSAHLRRFGPSLAHSLLLSVGFLSGKALTFDGC